MTKNIHTIVIEETKRGPHESVYINWTDLTSKKSWGFDRGNIGMAREIVEQIAVCLGVEAYVKEKNSRGVLMAQSGETN